MQRLAHHPSTPTTEEAGDLQRAVASWPRGVVVAIWFSGPAGPLIDVHSVAAGAVGRLQDAYLAGPLDGGSQQDIPGLSTFKGIVLGIIPWALVACVLAFIVGAAFWAVGSFSGNSQHSGSGKKTLVISLVAALLVGAAAVMVGWFNDRGKAVADPSSLAVIAVYAPQDR